MRAPLLKGRCAPVAKTTTTIVQYTHAVVVKLLVRFKDTLAQKPFKRKFPPFYTKQKYSGRTSR